MEKIMATIRILLSLVTFIIPLVIANKSNAQNWPQFRGPGGNAFSADTNIPSGWDNSKNMIWKCDLPGKGSSSPIVWKNNIFITCFINQESGIERSLLCIDKNSGKVMWKAVVKPDSQDDPYSGYLTQHGYASSTPVTDGESIFVFFGKAGVLAFDFSGKEIWRKSVGNKSGNRKWGSASSPILHKDMVIINASEESRAVIALNKKTGTEVWKAQGDKIELSYSTPFIFNSSPEKQVIILPVPGETWAINPDNGKLAWFAETPLHGNVSPTVTSKDDLIFCFGGFPQTKSIAIKAQGKGDLSANITWTSTDSSYVPSPIVFREHLYWVSDRGLAYCAETATGKVIYKERLPVKSSGGVARPVYASMILVNDKLIAVTRQDGTFVLKAGPSFQLISHNKISDETDFNASPAVSEGKLFLRSDKCLYCIGNP